MNIKYYYDKKYKTLFIKINDYAMIYFHKNYNILSIIILDKKFNQ